MNCWFVVPTPCGDVISTNGSICYSGDIHKPSDPTSGNAWMRANKIAPYCSCCGQFVKGCRVEPSDEDPVVSCLCGRCTMSLATHYPDGHLGGAPVDGPTCPDCGVALPFGQRRGRCGSCATKARRRYYRDHKRKSRAGVHTLASTAPTK